MIRQLMHQYHLISKLAHKIDVPDGQLERYVLRDKIERLEDIKYSLRSLGAFGDATLVSRTICGLYTKLKESEEREQEGRDT